MIEITAVGRYKENGNEYVTVHYNRYNPMGDRIAVEMAKLNYCIETPLLDQFKSHCMDTVIKNKRVLCAFQ